MKQSISPPCYRGFRFPPEVISSCAWWYFRFSLSFRDVEELLAQRGIVLTSETIRQWCLKFGQAYANEIKRRRPRMGDKWHLDEVYLKINGKTSYVWRAVDQYGNVLDILVQSRCNKNAEKRVLPQAAQRVAIRPACAHHRQAGQLHRRKEGKHV
jgi:putative transposase